MSMDSRHTAWLAIGGTLLVVGAGGVVTLEGSGQGTHFRLVELLLLVMAAVGVYGLFGPLLGLPMASPRSYPFWRRRPIPELPAVIQPTPIMPAAPLAPAQSEPPAPKRTIAAGGQRLLNRTPQQLMALYGNLTDVQGKLLVAPTIGQWIELEGTVADVSSTSGELIRLHLKEHPLVAIWFRGKKALERLILLHAGDRVAVQGEVEVIERHHVSLDPCELVDS
jgi:hypothetical protein